MEIFSLQNNSSCPDTIHTDTYNLEHPFLYLKDPTRFTMSNIISFSLFFFLSLSISLSPSFFSLSHTYTLYILCIQVIYIYYRESNWNSSGYFIPLIVCLLKLYLFLCICVLCVYFSTFHVYSICRSPKRASDSPAPVATAMWLLGIRPLSSGRAVSVLTT